MLGVGGSLVGARMLGLKMTMVGLPGVLCLTISCMLLGWYGVVVYTSYLAPSPPSRVLLVSLVNLHPDA